MAKPVNPPNLVKAHVQFSYYYVTVLHLFGYSVNGHFSIKVRVRVWYYFIFRERYMK